MKNSQALALAQFMDAQCRALTPVASSADIRSMIEAMNEFAKASGLVRRQMEWVLPSSEHWAHDLGSEPKGGSPV